MNLDSTPAFRSDERCAGLVLHLTCLPGPHGHGDLGAAAHRFAAWLQRAGLRLWQLLPLQPAGPGHSPYQSPSAFAGHPGLVALQPLVEAGWLDAAALSEGTQALPAFDPLRADFARAGPWRERLLAQAAAGFFAKASAGEQAAFEAWCAQQADWLPHWTLYAALKQAHGGQPWWAWAPALAAREGEALVSEAVRPEQIAEVVERARRLPGVESAAAVFGLPFGGTISRVRFTVEGRPPPAPNEPSDALYRQITPGYFETLRTPLLGGRDFDARDTTNAPRVVIVNEAFVRTFFPSADPRAVPTTRIDLDGGTNTWIQIVGVVRDMRDANLAQEAESQMFLPMTQRCWGFATLVVRAAGEPEALAPALREVVQAIDPEQPLERVRSLESLLDDTLTQRRIQTVLLGVFSALALVLAAVGIYGVMAWSVSRRSHEIGVRMALGAQWSDVRRLVLRQGMALTLMGVVLGLVAGLGLARFLAGLLYEVQPHDPPTFGTVTLALVAVALLACWLPARRAARVDPMVALRS